MLRANHSKIFPMALYVLALCSLCFAPVWAEQFTSGAVASVGGLGTPVTGDPDAMEWNPAALGEHEYTFQFLVTPLSARVSTDDWSLDTLFHLLEDRYTELQKKNVLKELKDGSIKGTFEYNSGAHVTLGGNGVGVSVRGYSSGAISTDGMALLLLGAEPGRTYQLANTAAESVAYGDVRVASVYSDPWLAKVLHISGFHMGGTLRYMQGLQYSKANASGTTLQVVNDNGTYRKLGDGQLYTLQSRAGWGVGTDLGLLIRLTPAIAVDASLVDLGCIWWQAADETILDYKVDPVTGIGKYELVSERETNTKPRWVLPLKVRTGLSISTANGVLWSLQYAKNILGSQPNEEWALATQLSRVEALPLRLAAKYSTVNRDLKFAFGLGIRLGPLMLDIGTPNLTGLLNHGKDASVSVSTGLRF